MERSICSGYRPSAALYVSLTDTLSANAHLLNTHSYRTHFVRDTILSTLQILTNLILTAFEAKPLFSPFQALGKRK